MKKLIFFFIFCTAALIADTTINIGTIDSEPKEKIEKFQAVATYLEEKLKKRDIKVGVEIPKDIGSAVDFINTKKLDIFIDSVYPTILVQKDTGITIRCKRWKKGLQGYRSLIFTKKDSPVEKMEDLKGRTIVFEDEFSTSGYYVPKNAILSKGLELSDKYDAQRVNFLFSKSEQNSAAWLLFDKVDAAALDEGSFGELEQKLFKVIYTSKQVPRHLVSFSKDMDQKLQKEILDILYTMHNDERGKEVLKKFSKTKKFSKLTEDDIRIIQGF